MPARRSSPGSRARGARDRGAPTPRACAAGRGRGRPRHRRPTSTRAKERDEKHRTHGSTIGAQRRVVVAPGPAHAGNVARCSCSCATARPTPTPVGCSRVASTSRCRSWAGARRRRSRRSCRPTRRVVASPLPARSRDGGRVRTRRRDRRTLDRARLRRASTAARSATCPPTCGRRGGPILDFVPARRRVARDARQPGTRRMRGAARRDPPARRGRREPRVADQGRDRAGPSAWATRSPGASSCRWRRWRASRSDPSGPTLHSFNELPRRAGLDLTRPRTRTRLREGRYDLGGEQPQVIEVVQVEHLQVDGRRRPRSRYSPMRSITSDGRPRRVLPGAHGRGVTSDGRGASLDLGVVGAAQHGVGDARRQATRDPGRSLRTQRRRVRRSPGMRRVWRTPR